MKEIEIKKGWYWSAGNTYGWTPEYGSPGVGLNRDLFNDTDKIRVKVNDEVYELDAQAGLEFIRKHKAHKQIGGTQVGFIPKDFMTKV